MLLKKIKTDFFVIVDIATPIRMNDSYLDDVGSIRKCVIEDSRYWKERTQYKRINYSTSPLSNCKSISLQEVKELIGEVDVEKKAESYAKDGLVLETPYANGLFYGYIKGYTQALKDNKEKKYAEEDVISIVKKSRETGLTAEYLMLTLQPKTEWEVEIVDGKLKRKNQ